MNEPFPSVLAPAETLRILLIEDDPSYRELCKRYLLKDKRLEYDIVEAANGADGIAACREECFDCLLVDYTLPDMKGTQLVTALSARLAALAPPVIILTANGGEEAATEAIRAGATDFFPKRFVSTGSLSRSINNAVEKGRLKRSIAERSQELENANQQLRSKSAEIQRFYQNVSHEVKTPLAATREFLAIVLDGIVGPVSSQQKEMLMHAVDSCDQITDHFNDLVEVTRLEAGKIILDKQWEPVEAVIARCVAATTVALRAKNITLLQELSPSTPPMHIDKNRIIQVVSNLLGNAIKYTNTGGVVKLAIRYYAKENRVTITISDTGCGISKDNLSHIFDRLFQVGHNDEEFTGAGLGLGLSIAKEIAVLHQGEIRAESVIGEGSTFTIDLPVNLTNEMEMLT